MNRSVIISQLGFANYGPVEKWYFKNNLPHTLKIFSRHFSTDTQMKLEFTIGPNETKIYSGETLRPQDEILAYVAVSETKNELAMPPYTLQPNKSYIVLGDILASNINDVTVRSHEHTVLPFINVRNEYFLPLNVYENRKLVAILGRNQPKADDSSVILRGDRGIPRGVHYDFQDQLTKKVIGTFVVDNVFVRDLRVGVINGYSKW